MDQMVRVVLVPQGVSEEAASDRQIILDLKLDTDTGMCTGPLPAFGRVGDFQKPETLYPFTLMRDGRMDFGSYATEEQRQDMFEIRTVRLAAGEEVAYRTGDQSQTYIIKTVMPLVP